MQVVTAVYPGSFDPVTNGHIDVAERASRVFGKVVVAVLNNPAKDALFSVDERTEMLRETLGHLPNVEIAHFSGLLVEFARQHGARVIVRGLRALSDFEYEFQMASVNRKIGGGIETVFMMTSNEHAFLSSSMVKEVARFGGCVRGFVPDQVARRLADKFRPAT
ncbi:MAG: pantetheine-phosphate adenylyltransferase [Firmicutes bacterium]|nr:pantetheine-phosphate adenylyltransferase [Bacillota bacterium]MDH7494892.1 pantetheine-phosphate adenylyltransferase [Bacillota bacterium]